MEHSLKCAVIVALCLFTAGAGYSRNDKAGIDTRSTANPADQPTISEDPAQEKPQSDSEDTSGLLNAKNLQKILQQERKAILREIDLERKATLAELETIGNRTIENTFVRSESLIDHFFLRVFQLTLFIMLVISFFGYIGFRITAKRRKS